MAVDFLQTWISCHCGEFQEPALDICVHVCNCNSAWHTRVPRLKFDKDYFYTWSSSHHVFRQAVLQYSSGAPFRMSYKHSTTIYNPVHISFLIVLTLCKCVAQPYTKHECSLSFKFWLLILKMTKFSELMLVIPSVLFVKHTRTRLHSYLHPEYVSAHVPCCATAQHKLLQSTTYTILSTTWGHYFIW